MEGTTRATTTTIIQTTSALAAARLVLTVSGASVNATEVGIRPCWRSIAKFKHWWKY